MGYEELRQALAVLALSERANLGEIKARHRDLVKRFHPDAGGGTRLASRRTCCCSCTKQGTVTSNTISKTPDAKGSCPPTLARRNAPTCRQLKHLSGWIYPGRYAQSRRKTTGADADPQPAAAGIPEAGAQGRKFRVKVRCMLVIPAVVVIGPFLERIGDGSFSQTVPPAGLWKRRP
jgi:hypothetical protein